MKKYYWIIAIIAIILIIGVYTITSLLPFSEPTNYCKTDSDCIKEPCCYSCNSKIYSDYLIESGKDICMAVACTKDFTCSCVNNNCQASGRAY